MRESSIFEVRLDRFGVWRAAVAGVATVAVAAALAWAAATAIAGDDTHGGAIVVGALSLSAATLALAISLARVRPGTLACVEGVWSFAPDVGRPRSGALMVALDWGSFLLLRVGSRPRVLWLPVQRRGLERHWHALRCAVYAPPAAAARAKAASAAAVE